jgi:hypothetical protein
MQEFVDKSIDFYNKREYDKALKISNEILKIDPSNVRAYQISVKSVVKLNKDPSQLIKLAQKYLPNDIYQTLTKPKGKHLFGNVHIPNELTVYILSMLPFTFLFVISQVNKSWLSFISTTPVLFKKISFPQSKLVSSELFIRVLKSARGNTTDLILNGHRGISSSALVSNAKTHPLRQLKSIQIRRMNHLSSKSLQTFMLPSLKSLSSLQISDYSFDAALFTLIWRGCIFLETFEVTNSDLDRSDLPSTELPSLKSLNLSNSTFKTAMIPAVFKLARNIRSVALNHCTSIDIGVLKTVTSLKQLESLSLNGIPTGNLSQTAIDNQMLFLANKCTELKSLSFAKSAFLSVSCCEYLAEFRNESLTHLNISECSNATDEALAKFQICANLRYLNVEKCSRITDSSLSVVVKKCTKLKTLSVAYNSNLSGSFLRLPSKIKNLDISGCLSIPRDVILGLSRYRMDFLRLNDLSVVDAVVLDTLRRSIKTVSVVK